MADGAACPDMGVMAMAGKGPSGKHPDQRARRNKDPAPLRVVTLPPAPQPELPTLSIEVDGKLCAFTWPGRTVEWWRMWGESPLAAEFSAVDWSELLDTALLHARYWRGDLRLAGELRLRSAKFGATPEDRLRLRIMAVAGDEHGDQDEPEEPPSPYGDLRLVD